jgi:hypothetical protein
MFTDNTFCKCCGTYQVEIIMLKDEVWERINPDKKGWICVACMEDKLDRQITSKDMDLVRYIDYAEQRQRLRDNSTNYRFKEVGEFLFSNFRSIYDQLKKMMP